MEGTRAGWQFFNRTGEADFALVSPDIVWHTRSDLPESATYVGHQGVREVSEQWRGIFEDLRIVIDELIEAHDLVVVVLRLRGRIKGSDDTVEMTETHVNRWREGKIVEIHEYRTKAEALEAFDLEC
jgi:ketosteroid isomerase-like protein